MGSEANLAGGSAAEKIQQSRLLKEFEYLKSINRKF